MKKAQVSIEYMFVIGSILLIFGLMMLIVNFNKERNDGYEKLLNSREKCVELADAISQVYIAGDGAEKTVLLTNYNVTITSNGTIDIFSFSISDPTVHEDLISCSFIGQVAATQEANTGVTIRNRWGVVHIG